MKTCLSFLFLLLALSVNAQYKRFSLNALAGMSNQSFGYKYKCLGIQAEYNFKSTFSIVAGIERETGKFRISDFYEFPQPYHYETAMVSFSNWSIPLMGKVTFGKKRVFLYIQAGAQGYNAPRATGEVTHSNTNEQWTKTYLMNGTLKIDGVYGAGLAISLTKNINFFCEFRDSPFEQINPRSEKDDLRSYSHFRGARVLLGVSWQFNAKKGSEYSASRWYPQFQKN